MDSDRHDLTWPQCVVIVLILVHIGLIPVSTVYSVIAITLLCLVLWALVRGAYPSFWILMGALVLGPVGALVTHQWWWALSGPIVGIGVAFWSALEGQRAERARKV